MDLGSHSRNFMNYSKLALVFVAAYTYFLPQNLICAAIVTTKSEAVSDLDLDKITIDAFQQLAIAVDNATDQKLLMPITRLVMKNFFNEEDTKLAWRSDSLYGRARACIETPTSTFIETTLTSLPSDADRYSLVIEIAHLIASKANPQLLLELIKGIQAANVDINLGSSAIFKAMRENNLTQVQNLTSANTRSGKELYVIFSKEAGCDPRFALDCRRHLDGAGCRVQTPFETVNKKRHEPRNPAQQYVYEFYSNLSI